LGGDPLDQITPLARTDLTTASVCSADISMQRRSLATVFHFLGTCQ